VILNSPHFYLNGSLNTEYRKWVGEYAAITDATRIGKANFLEFYVKARQIGLSKKNIESGWRATGLYPKNVNKPLCSCWVVTSRSKTPLPPSNLNISTPKHRRNLLQLLAENRKSPSSQLSIRKVAAVLDKVAIEIVLRDCEIERLQTLLDWANLPKRCKVS
jgi:hypothetical protein